MILTLPSKTRRINLTPVDYSKALYKMGMPLSIVEEELKEAFRKVESNSLWGLAIRDMFVDYTDTKFRELVCELLSQCHDCPDTMYRILGKQSYDLLLKLKP
jgi:hypothetical protein